MDYDFITTCNWTATGTYTLRAYRGSYTDVVTSYSLFYRKKGTTPWTETTNGEVVISSTGEWEIGNDWNKDANNNVLSHHYNETSYINSCTSITYDETALGTTVGAYFLYGLFDSCYNLSTIGADALLPVGLTTVGTQFLTYTFRYISITSLPDNFNIPPLITTIDTYFLSRTFYSCDLTSLPDDFQIPTGIAGDVNGNFLYSTFGWCQDLTSLPDDFQIPTGITDAGTNFLEDLFYRCSSLTSLPISFQLPTGITVAGRDFLEGTFHSCSNLTAMPVGFQIPTGIAGYVSSDFMKYTWAYCSKLETMPVGFDIPSGITGVGSDFMDYTWYNCTALKNDRYTEPITFEFTTGTNTFGGSCPITADDPVVGTKVTPVLIEVNRPSLSTITGVQTAQGINTITF